MVFPSLVGVLSRLSVLSKDAMIMASIFVLGPCQVQ